MSRKPRKRGRKGATFIVFSSTWDKCQSSSVFFVVESFSKLSGCSMTMLTGQGKEVESVQKLSDEENYEN